jgi:hypothetical protein
MQPQDSSSPNEQPLNVPENGVQPPVSPTIDPAAQQVPVESQQVGASITPNMPQQVEPTVVQPVSQPTEPLPDPVMPQQPGPMVAPATAPQQPEQFTSPAPQDQQMAPQPQVSTEDPGKTLSILGICLFIIPIIGISLSIIGMMKSKGSGYSGKLGKIGVGVNIASIVLSLLFFVVFPILFAKHAVDQLSNSQVTTPGSQTSQSDSSKTGLVVGMSKTDVSKAMGVKLVGCSPGLDGKGEICVYRDGSAPSNSLIFVSATFIDGKMTRATGYTTVDNVAKPIRVGS